jgi:hypothetical protein
VQIRCMVNPEYRDAMGALHGSSAFLEPSPIHEYDIRSFELKGNEWLNSNPTSGLLVGLQPRCWHHLAAGLIRARQRSVLQIHVIDLFQDGEKSTSSQHILYFNNVNSNEVIQPTVCPA